MAQSDAADSRLTDCANKFANQFQLIKEGKIPECVDKKTLKELEKSLETYKKFYKELPYECMTFKRENLGYCLKEFSQLLQGQSKDMQYNILNSLKIFVKTVSKCWDDAKGKVQKLDQYILNGCKDL